MAILNPGTSSLSSTTYEDALMEAIALYRKNLASGATSNVTYSVGNNGATFTANATLALSVTTTNSGSISILPVNEVDSAFTWSADPSSDIKAASLPAQITALVSKINEGTPLAGNNTDRVTASVNLDARTVAINVNFALTPTFTPDAAIAFVAQGYIADFA